MDSPLSSSLVWKEEVTCRVVSYVIPPISHLHVSSRSSAAGAGVNTIAVATIDAAAVQLAKFEFYLFRHGNTTGYRLARAKQHISLWLWSPGPKSLGDSTLFTLSILIGTSVDIQLLRNTFL